MNIIVIRNGALHLIDCGSPTPAPMPTPTPAPTSAPPPPAPLAVPVPDLAHDPLTTSGLVYGYKGGTIFVADGFEPYAIAAGVAYLPPNSTTYLSARQDPDSPVTANPGGFITSTYAMAVVTTDADSITSITDARDFRAVPRPPGLSLTQLLEGQHAFSRPQSVIPRLLDTSESVFAPNASESNNFVCVLTSNTVTAPIYNLTDGMVLNFAIRQDAVGGRTLTFDDSYTFPGGIKPVLSTAPNAVDYLRCYYDASSGKLLCQFTAAYA